MREDLLKQQAEADRLFEERTTQHEKLIEGFNKRITVAKGIIAETTKNIAALEKKIAELKAKIAGLEKALAGFKKALEELRAVDAAERAAHAKRVAQYNMNIEGLDAILERLTAERNNAPEGKKDYSALLQLGKIGKSNPIAALVEIALALPKEQWDKAIELMTGLRNKATETKAADIENEAARIAQFEKDQAHLETTIANTEKQLADTRAELQENEDALADNQRRKAAAEAELANATQEKENEIKAYATYKANYERDSQKRSEEVHIVEQVQEIFSSRIASAKDYLK